MIATFLPLGIGALVNPRILTAEKNADISPIYRGDALFL